ncbi:TadA family conjugal transfer-associated ATPase [Desertihabitans aurantiacus]|uniref:TadA family conjugal transfer-associated ATPase n=1 Tax=Desertihabitans aurantiacus TaxID=2282477 RepID=UPI000DF73507|nr:TadA family conjugal transfer-associated ATPase [Desertihabitans aurantiacus]
MSLGAPDLDLLRPRLAELGREPAPADVAREMRALGWVVTDESLLATLEWLRRDALGAGPLDPLLGLPGVTDVLVNGPQHVYLDRGHGLERVELQFADDDEVRRLAARLAARVGRRLDDAAPFVDARLADGTRVHAVLGTLADPGTCLSLRVPARGRFTLQDWVRVGSLPPAGAELLRGLVACRAAFLVSGGTGSGKTTLLAALLSLVPPQERLLVVEDSRELDPDHPHCVRLEGRPPNAEGAGRVTLSDLVRQALRMRPDRVVLGEVRGAELCDLLTALNTGHEGGCGTVHANSAVDVPARLEALAALGGMSREALHSQAAAALDAVVHIRREGGRRRVDGISVLLRDETTDRVRTVPAVTFGDGVVHKEAGGEALERLLSR